MTEKLVKKIWEKYKLQRENYKKYIKKVTERENKKINTEDKNI